MRGRVGTVGDRWLRFAANLAAIGLFVVVAMGVLVTDSGSELGCGHDWPLCHGKFLPGPAIHTLVEYSHRSVAAVVGLLVVIAAVWAWRRYGEYPEVRWLGLLAVVFVVIEGLLGAAAVLWTESAAVLALHFGFSLTALGASVLLAAVVGQLTRGHTGPLRPGGLDAGVVRWSWATMLYIYGLVYLGAYVAHTGSGLGCLGWPLCNGALIPHLQGATLIVFSHRVGAALLLAMMVWVRVRVGRCHPARPDLVLGANLTLLTGVLQIASGAVLILTRLNGTALFVHGTMVSFLFASVAYLCFQTLPPVQPRAARARAA